MSKVLTTIVFIVTSMLLVAQNFINSEALQNKGLIPQEFFSNESVIPHNDLVSNSAVTKIEQNDILRYESQTNFAIKELLHSGQLLYGDILTNYVNSVADKLLSKFPDVRKSVRIYVSLFPDVNAACLPNGIVIVNVGLLAKLENEAQLAYTIAHEIVHYIKKHGIESFLEGNRIIRKKGDYKSLTRDNSILAFLSYRKELEFEADEKGFSDFFKQSGYKLSESISLCDLLAYSNFPVEEIDITRDLIEDEWFAVPNSYWLDSIKSISPDNYEADSLSTHPNISKRKQRLEYMQQNVGDSGSLFLLPNVEFFQARDAARLQLCDLYLEDQKYIEAIYLASIMQQKYPQDNGVLLRKSCAYYGIARLASIGSVSKCMKPKEKCYGEIQRMYHLIRACTQFQTVTIACRELWKIHKIIPNDSIIFAQTKEAFYLLSKMSDFKDEFFKLSLPDLPEPIEISQDSLEKLTKYERLKLTQGRYWVSDPFKTAFLEFAQDIEFTTFYEAQTKDTEKNKQRIISRKSKERTNKRSNGYYLEDYKLYTRWEKTKDLNLPSVDKIICFNPQRFRVNKNMEIPSPTFEDIEKKKSINESIKQVSNMVGMDVALLDIESFSAESTTEYNDYQTIRKWNENIINNENLNSIGFNQTEMEDLMKRYGTPYIANIGIINTTIKPSPYERFPLLIVEFTCPFILPALLIYWINHKITLYYFELYDIRTNRKVFSENIVLEMDDNIQIVKQLLYNTLFNLKNNSHDL